MAKAKLQPSEDSVSFTERELFLANGPVKVGRSVGDLRPAPHNAYFHCKVLSRNHALIWFDSAQQRFYVRDTKSSNGTFVNKQKIGPLEDGSECPPFEIFSGDVMQFGVEVQEATKKDKDGNPITVTHGCIITQVKLNNPDGSEYLPPPSVIDQQQQHLQSVIATHDLYILNKYLKEAKEREAEVEKKLSSFLDVIQQLEKQAETGCDNVIREDYLLSKIEILEAQVAAYNNLSVAGSSTAAAREQNDELGTFDGDEREEDAVTIAGDFDQSSGTNRVRNGTANGAVHMQQQRIDELNNIKQLYEQGARETLHRAMHEKLAALDHVVRVETELGKCQSECEYLKNNCLAVEAALKDLIQRHQDQLERSTQLLQELKDAEQQKNQLQTDALRDKRELELRIDDANKKVEQLSAEVHDAVQESTSLKEQLENLEAMRTELLEELEHYRGKEYCDESAQTDLTMLLDEAEFSAAEEEDEAAKKVEIRNLTTPAMSLLADESAIHSTPNRSSNFSTPGRSANRRRISSTTNSRSGSDAEQTDAAAEKSLFSDSTGLRSTFDVDSPFSFGKRNDAVEQQRAPSIIGRFSTSPIPRTLSRQLDTSSNTSFAANEKQSVEKFLDSINSNDSTAATDENSHRKPFSTSPKPPRAVSPTTLRARSEVDDNTSGRNSPYYSPPLSPPPPLLESIARPRAGLYARQDTLTESNSSNRKLQQQSATSCAAAMSSAKASSLEERLCEIEYEISRIAHHSKADQLEEKFRELKPHKIVDGLPYDRYGNRLDGTVYSLTQYGVMDHVYAYKELVFGTIAALGAGYAWLNYNS